MSGEYYEQEGGGLGGAMVGQGVYANQVTKRVTIREETNGQLRYHEKQVEVKKAMLKLLDENPAIEQFMDLSRQ